MGTKRCGEKRPANTDSDGWNWNSPPKTGTLGYFMTLRFLGFIASYQLEDGEVNIDGFAKLLCKLVGSGTPRWKDSI